MKYYIAYGSNLNKAQMQFRCPGATVFAKGKILDWRLMYKGSKTGSYLTIEQSKGCYVPIVIWVVSNEDEKNLDIYEGFPRFYYKKQFRISTSRGPIKAFAYIMTDGRSYGIPTDRYIDTCTEGYRDFGFDTGALTKAYTDTVEEMSK